jgi:hypothetical protein
MVFLRLDIRFLLKKGKNSYLEDLVVLDSRWWDIFEKKEDLGVGLGPTG